MMKIKTVVAFLFTLLMLGSFVGCEKNDSDEDFGGSSIYMPQSLSSGGIDSMYLVPSGGGEETYNFKAKDGKIEIILGVMLPGKYTPEAGLTVDVKTFSDITNNLIASGQIQNAVVMPDDIYTLPTQVTVTNSRKATFYLSVDSAKLMNDLAYLGQNLVLTVGITNPTKYQLSDKNTHTTVVINRDAIYDHFFKYKEGFLYRTGNKLMLNGKEYHCAGINSPVLTGCASPTEKFSDEEIDHLFASLPNNVLVRTKAFLSMGKDEIDKIIKSAEKNNIKLILVLGDGHSSCGDTEGASNGEGSSKTQEWYSSGYQQEYLQHVKYMATTYKNSPAVGMWEMLNQAVDVDNQYIKSFYNDVAKALKDNDPNHLVATGAWADWTYGGQAGYESIQDSKYIDVGTVNDEDYDVVPSWHWATCKQAMDDLNKALIVNNIGVNGGDGTGCIYDKSGRADMVKNKFDFYLDNGAGAALISYLVKDVSDDCTESFAIDDPIVNVVETLPANMNLGK